MQDKSSSCSSFFVAYMNINSIATDLEYAKYGCKPAHKYLDSGLK
jgi:hypothetical protein